MERNAGKWQFLSDAKIHDGNHMTKVTSFILNVKEIYQLKLVLF